MVSLANSFTHTGDLVERARATFLGKWVSIRLRGIPIGVVACVSSVSDDGLVTARYYDSPGFVIEYRFLVTFALHSGSVVVLD